VINAPPAKPMVTAANTVPTPARKEVVLKAISHLHLWKGNATGKPPFPGLDFFRGGTISSRRNYFILQWNFDCDRENGGHHSASSSSRTTCFSLSIVSKT
jgi:hypothetical protein